MRRFKVLKTFILEGWVGRAGKLLCVDPDGDADLILKEGEPRSVTLKAGREIEVNRADLRSALWHHFEKGNVWDMDIAEGEKEP